MSKYRFLEDHFVGGNYYQAGSTAATADVGGTLPTGWPPSNAVDPLDAAAVNAFYAAGPRTTAPALTRWSGMGVNAPATYWLATPGAVTKWQLTGLGKALAPIFM